MINIHHQQRMKNICLLYEKYGKNGIYRQNDTKPCLKNSYFQ